MSPQKRKKIKQIRDIYPLLQVLKDNSTNVNLRRAILNHINDEGINLLCHCINETLMQQELPDELHDLIKEKLSPYKLQIRYVSRNPHNHIKNRAKLKQTGAGIGAILAAVLPILTGLLFPSSKK